MIVAIIYIQKYSYVLCSLAGAFHQLCSAQF